MSFLYLVSSSVAFVGRKSSHFCEYCFALHEWKGKRMGGTVFTIFPIFFYIFLRAETPLQKKKMRKKEEEKIQQSENMD